LSPEKAFLVTAHEMGHMVDSLADRIPVEDIRNELNSVYNDLNNPALAQARAQNPEVDPWSSSRLRNYGPEAHKYKGEASDRELIAEAIRAYFADPNYLKSVAPATAARIRAHVNSNPRLSPYVQFNSVTAPTPLGLLFTSPSPSSQAQRPQ
jgi:hypothetical protein